MRLVYLRTGLIRWQPCADCGVAVSSASDVDRVRSVWFDPTWVDDGRPMWVDEGRSQDGSEPVSSDIERFDEGIVPPPPDMTDDEDMADDEEPDDEEHDDEHDMVGVDIKQLDEGGVPFDVANEEKPWDVDAAMSMVWPMGLAPMVGAAAETMPSGVGTSDGTGVVASTKGALHGTGVVASTQGTSDPSLTEAVGTGVVASTTKGTSDPGLTVAGGTGVVAATMPSSSGAIPSRPPHAADASELADAHPCLDCEPCSLGLFVEFIVLCSLEFAQEAKEKLFRFGQNLARASDPLLDLLDNLCTFE